MTREQIAEAFGVPFESVPAPGSLQEQAEILAQAWRNLGGEVARALRLEQLVEQLSRVLIEGHARGVVPVGLFASVERGYPYKPRHKPRRPRKVAR